MSKGTRLVKLLAIKVECSHELEDGLSFFMQDELNAQGIESRKQVTLF